ncbi:MAG: SCP2 sterol-binding domain-containing protein [Candidatus Aminicenantales bacterium]
MSYFKEREEMYSIYEALFDRVSTHPEVGPALADSGLIVSFKLNNPEGEFTVNCREKPEEKGKYISAVFGACGLKPDFAISASADFCHKFWLGKVDIVTSLFSGEARAEGDFSKAMKLLPVLKSVNKLYIQMLEELGRKDLIVS